MVVVETLGPYSILMNFSLLVELSAIELVFLYLLSDNIPLQLWNSEHILDILSCFGRRFGSSEVDAVCLHFC
ncbi:hypothetical protein TorRG33x02_297210 [Trema orientale]|uniref:Uncharacterized protein n=1 Tax=Trema orientale TaxID=63057 RepID=A0A2P5C595_TREOI|nr:hypothetical protein TorRG33x02_297210 [Trema orientale]